MFLDVYISVLIEILPKLLIIMSVITILYRLTHLAKWCEVALSLKFSELLKMSESSSSHQNLFSWSLEDAVFREIQDEVSKHSAAQSSNS